MEVHVIVQEAVIKTTLKKKKCKKEKWFSEEALKIAEKRREAKGKGEKEWYKQLNAEFQRKARSNKKAFLNDQCKEIEENNRKGKTRDLFKKKRYQGNISCKDRHNKGQKKKILRRGGKNTQKNYTKKDLHGPDNHAGAITRLEPDIQEYEVKWALGSITLNKVSGIDEISVALFQILKDDAVKVLHSIYQQIWKTQQWPKD